MGGLDMLLKAVLNATGIDPEELKKEFQNRVANFEQNMATLNATLISLDKRLARIEEKLGIEVSINGTGNGTAQITNQSDAP